MTTTSYTDLNTIQNNAVNIPVQEAWFDGVRDDFEFLARNAPYAHVFNSALISIPNNVLTAITFDTEREDTGGCHSTSSNTSRLIAPLAGIFSLGGSISIAANATGIRQAALRVNGSLIVAETTIASAGAGSGTEFMLGGVQWRLAVSDYVELMVLQNSGGALNLQFAASFSPECWFEWSRL